MFQVRNAAEEESGLARLPAQGVEDVSGVHHRLQPTAALSRPLHRQQQRQQLLLVGRSGVFAQGLPERHMLRLGLGREPGGVGGHEGERVFGIAAVLRQIEMHPSDQIPGRVQPLEEGLQVQPRPGQRAGEGGAQFPPQRRQHLGGQIFRPGHHRSGENQAGKLCGSRRRPLAKISRRLSL